jgi:two-component system, LytTR family, sensor kinase
MSEGVRPSLVGRRAAWAVAAGFWGFVAAVSAAQMIWQSQASGQPMETRGWLTWQTIYFLTWIPFTIGVWRLTGDWLPERFGGWLRLLAAHLAVWVVVAVAQTWLVILCAQVVAMNSPAMRESFTTQLRSRLNVQFLIYTAIAGAGAAMTLAERDRDRQAAAAKLQAELTEARLQALRGHLQPHFLFNSLHSIAALARAGDTAGVVRLIAALSDLLRHVLDAGARHTSLREELQIVEQYLEIQRARFADRLDVTVDVAPDVADARVPLLIVQPLVENAVRHGLAPRVRQGSLMVRAMRENGCTRIDVEDTGIGLPPGWRLANANGTGLRTLASRLAAEFGDTAALNVAPREGGGVRATVTLPYAPL